MEQSSSTKPDIAVLKSTAIKKILYPALLGLAFTIFYYFYASYLDGLTASIKINVLIAMVYNSMGTMGGTALLGGISLVSLGVFAFKWMNIKKQETIV